MYTHIHVSDILIQRLQHFSLGNQHKVRGTPQFVRLSYTGDGTHKLIIIDHYGQKRINMLPIRRGSCRLSLKKDLRGSTVVWFIFMLKMVSVFNFGFCDWLYNQNFKQSTKLKIFNTENIPD